MRALVLGGYGAVGADVVHQLRAIGIETLVAGRDAARADRVIDISQPGTARYRAALARIDVVVNASGVEDISLATVTTEHGVAFVDITATSGYVEALERLNPPRPVLLSVGLAPGLSNLLAAAVHDAAPGPIDIALLLGAGDRHGVAATTWSSRLLGRRFRSPDGQVVRNYTQPLRFDLPYWGRRRMLRADFSDQHVLSRDFGVPVRTYVGLDSRLATGLLAGLTRIPRPPRLPRGPHPPGSDRWLVLARAANGLTRWAAGRRQSHATALVTAAAVRTVPELTRGVHHLHRVATLGDVSGLPDIDLGPAT